MLHIIAAVYKKYSQSGGALGAAVLPDFIKQAFILAVCGYDIQKGRDFVMTGSIIRLEHICKSYKTGSGEVPALQDITLDIKNGEFTAIVGASGSGKSTLMNILGCLDTPDSGEYILDGMAVKEQSGRRLDNIRSRKIGFIFQRFSLIPTLTALENVQLPLYYAAVPYAKRYAKAKSALAAVGLSARMNHKPNQLSGGQQQRVSAARALVTEPKIILADEPTGNLDSRSGAALFNMLKSLNSSGRTLVLITHDMQLARQADRMIEIADGKVVRQ